MKQFVFRLSVNNSRYVHLPKKFEIRAISKNFYDNLQFYILEKIQRTITNPQKKLRELSQLSSTRWMQSQNTEKFDIFSTEKLKKLAFFQVFRHFLDNFSDK